MGRDERGRAHRSVCPPPGAWLTSLPDRLPGLSHARLQALGNPTTRGAFDEPMYRYAVSMEAQKDPHVEQVGRNRTGRLLGGVRVRGGMQGFGRRPQAPRRARTSSTLSATALQCYKVLDRDKGQ